MQQPTSPPMIRCLCHNKDQNIITDIESGEIICGNCGMVILEKTQDDTHQEQRAFTLDEAYNRARTGSPISLARHDMGLSTIIGRDNKDAKGHTLDTTMRYTIERLRIIDVRTQLNNKSPNKNFQQAFNNLNILKDKLGLSDAIVEKTAYIYRKAFEKKLIRRTSKLGVLAAAAYIACREIGAPRTFNEFALIMNIKRKDITRCYKLMAFELDIKIPTVEPINCIIRITNRLKLSDKTKRQAIRIMNNIAKEEISAGKNPMGFAASVLYLSSIMIGDNNVKQRIFAEAAGVTDVTIRNICRAVRKKYAYSIK
jgi:transcription initiation factor TFIIB